MSEKKSLAQKEAERELLAKRAGDLYKAWQKGGNALLEALKNPPQALKYSK